MSRTFIHLSVSKRPVPGEIQLRTVYQSPFVTSLGRLPFTASNGTVIAASMTGRPSVAVTQGRTPKVTVMLRTNACPLKNWDDPAVVRIPDGIPQSAVSDAIRVATKELRNELRNRSKFAKAS